MPAPGAPAPESGSKKGKIVTLFAPKGGVGRTTLAVNLAVAMAGEQRQTVTLVDGSFQFGDVGVLLNLNPKNKSIIDVVADPSATDEDLVDTTLINHSTGIKVLLAPPSPEMAELITVDQIRRMMGRLRETNDFTVVDLWPHFNDVSLALLDMSDVILTILTLEITNIKNIRLFLEVAEQLGYGDRLKLVLNRADSAFGDPRRGRRELGRPQDRPPGRLRWPHGRLCTQPRCSLRLEQQPGSGQRRRPQDLTRARFG